MEEFGVELDFLELLGDLAFCLWESAVYMKNLNEEGVALSASASVRRRRRRRRRILKIREGVFLI